ECRKSSSKQCGISAWRNRATTGGDWLYRCDYFELRDQPFPEQREHFQGGLPSVEGWETAGHRGYCCQDSPARRGKTRSYPITGCMAGAALIDDLQRMLADSGFTQIRIKPKEESKSFIQDW